MMPVVIMRAYVCVSLYRSIYTYSLYLLFWNSINVSKLTFAVYFMNHRTNMVKFAFAQDLERYGRHLA